MAKFSEQFIASLLQPSFTQGMFNLGTAIGSAPGQVKERNRMEAYRKMTPEQQLAYDKANAKTTEEIQAVQRRERALLEQKEQTLLITHSEILINLLEHYIL